MRRRMKRFLMIPFSIMLIALPIHAYAQYIDCRTCHSPGGASGAVDFSQYYDHPADGHPIGPGYYFNHPIGLKYPTGFDAYLKFKPTNGLSGDIAFFDTNGNGQPDEDEVQLFANVGGASGDFTIECASCHKAHGSDPATPGTPGNLYLRISNQGSALCLTCHLK